MPKHLVDPVLHPSWLHRDDYTVFEFPARPESSLLSDDSSSLNGACGESSTGAGSIPRSLAYTLPPQGDPVPVGHLSLTDRIKAALERIDEMEKDCP